jgi:ssDNA-binding Zn-finger/Zn-ribbon topoisomerase 1
MCETLEKYAPVILDEGMTSEMDKKLEEIEVSKKDFEKKEKVILENAKKVVTKIADGMSANLAEMGKSLADANAVVWEEEKEANTLDKCRVCGKGNLRIMYGKKFGRYFVSCDAYPACKTIYSLPPKGQMRPARIQKVDDRGQKIEELDICGDCGFPLVQSFQKGKAPWKFCFNMECASNEEAKKKKAEFKAKMASGEVEIVDGKVVDHKKKSKKKLNKKESTATQ